MTFNQYLKAIGKNILSKNNLKEDVATLKLNLRILDSEYRNYLLTGGFLRIINEFFTTGEISDPSYDVYLRWIIGDLARWDLKEGFSKQIIKKIMESYASEL